MSVGDTSPYTTAIMHLLPLNDYDSAALYGFDVVNVSGEYMYTDVGYIGSTVL